MIASSYFLFFSIFFFLSVTVSVRYPIFTYIHIWYNCMLTHVSVFKLLLIKRVLEHAATQRVWLEYMYHDLILGHVVGPLRQQSSSSLGTEGYHGGRPSASL